MFDDVMSGLSYLRTMFPVEIGCDKECTHTLESSHGTNVYTGCKTLQ